MSTENFITSNFICKDCGAVVALAFLERHEEFHRIVTEVKDAVWKAGMLND